MALLLPFEIRKEEGVQNTAIQLFKLKTRVEESMHAQNWTDFRNKVFVVTWQFFFFRFRIQVFKELYSSKLPALVELRLTVALNCKVFQASLIAVMLCSQGSKCYHPTDKEKAAFFCITC